jgi:hypothetical protein
VSIGLDLGTTLFRSIRSTGTELVGRQCGAVYIVLTDTVSHRRLLEQSGVRFATCGNDLVIFGQPAVEWGDILNLPVISLLPEGRVPQSDPVARQILALMVDAVLPPAETIGDVCCLTVPGGHDLSRNDLPYDVRFFQQLVALRGYEPRLMTAGLAVVLAELSAASFSGIGICFGAGSCHVGVVHCGRELANFYFDECLVDQSLDRLDAGTAADGIESNPAKAAAREHLMLRALTETLTATRDELARRDVARWMSQPTHVVCTGRPTAEPGFLDLFMQVWSSLDWPMKVGTLQVADDAIYSIARGCLIQSRLENRPASSRAA